MSEKQFVHIKRKGKDFILENPNYELDFIEMLGDSLEAEEVVNRLNELLTKNRQLEKRIHIYETTLKEAIQNERTHLGHNALKQLADNLGVEV